MPHPNTFLCLDPGAGALKAAEFEVGAGTLSLRRYAVRDLPLESALEGAREKALADAIRRLFSEDGFTARRAYACAPNLQVFSRFLKLPPFEDTKLAQVIQYEAQQNLPVALADAAWDYQVLGAGPGSEYEVLLAALKTENATRLCQAAEAAGVQIQRIDAPVAALVNVFRFNYGAPDTCTMLLDVGARSSHVLFFDRSHIYARSINIGGHAITQEFAAETRLRMTEAERLKLAVGFVSLGGAYESPADAREEALSKIARQVLTRLHVQIVQALQLFRSQHGGSAPERVLLTGGASIMPYAAQFFGEKLRVPVEYFNPLRNVEIGPGIAVEPLASAAHQLGLVVGLGLHGLAQCPIELNLLPAKLQARQQFDAKKPYLMATALSLAFMTLAYGWFFDRMADVKASALSDFQRKLEPLSARETELKQAESGLAATKARADALLAVSLMRFLWPDVLSELRSVLVGVETQWEEGQPGTKAGVWVETMGNRDDSAPAVVEDEPRPRFLQDPLLRARYQLPEPKTVEARPDDSEVPVRFRAVSLNAAGDSAANARLAFAVESAIRASPFFERSGTRLSGEMGSVESHESTFTFVMTLKLKRPAPLTFTRR